MNLQLLFQAGVLDSIIAIAAAGGFVGGFALAKYRNRIEQKRFRSLSRYLSHVEHELESLRKTPTTATVQRARVVPIRGHNAGGG